MCESCCSFFVAKRMSWAISYGQKKTMPMRGAFWHHNNLFSPSQTTFFFRSFWASRRNPRTYWNLIWKGQRTIPDLEAILPTRRYGLKSELPAQCFRTAAWEARRDQQKDEIKVVTISVSVSLKCSLCSSQTTTQPERRWTAMIDHLKVGCSFGERRARKSSSSNIFFG